MKNILMIFVFISFLIPGSITASEVHYLYNSEGKWIAFQKGKYIFDTSAEWVGWLGWGDNDVADRDGKYLGTIVQGNRLYFFTNHSFRGNPGYPGSPAYPGRPAYPGQAGYSSLPSGAEDINIK